MWHVGYLPSHIQYEFMEQLLNKPYYSEDG